MGERKREREGERHLVLVDHSYMIVSLVVRIECDGLPLPLTVRPVCLEVVIETGDEGARSLTQVNRVQLHTLRNHLECPQHLLHLRPCLQKLYTIPKY